MRQQTLRAFVALALAALPALAAAQSADLPPAQRGGTFHEPPARVPREFIPDGPDGVRADAGADKPALTLRLTLEFPLDRGGATAGAGAQGGRSRTPTAQAHLRWHPIRGSHWFAQFGFFRYLDGGSQQAWNPDFTYGFGYEDFRPGTFSLVYNNHTGTRLSPDRSRGENRFNFSQGQWTVGYKFGLPQALEDFFLAGDGDSALCSVEGHLVPRYGTGTAPGLQSGKFSASVGCRYTHPAGWFAHARLFAWPDRTQQQPWDPDVTYGLGWETPFQGPWGHDNRLTIEYANYSGNRLFGGARGAGEGTFRSGSLLLSWTLHW